MSKHGRVWPFSHRHTDATRYRVALRCKIPSALTPSWPRQPALAATVGHTLELARIALQTDFGQVRSSPSRLVRPENRPSNGSPVTCSDAP